MENRNERGPIDNNPMQGPNTKPVAANPEQDDLIKNKEKKKEESYMDYNGNSEQNAPVMNE